MITKILHNASILVEQVPHRIQINQSININYNYIQSWLQEMKHIELLIVNRWWFLIDLVQVADIDRLDEEEEEEDYENHDDIDDIDKLDSEPDEE